MLHDHVHATGLDALGEYKGESDYQLERISTFFDEATTGRYLARTVLTDLDEGSLLSVRARTYGALFRAENFVSATRGAANNWARGRYAEGAELMDSVLDAVRSEVEMCDSLQGFQITHSLGGGTGSGLGALLIERLREEFPDRMVLTFSVVPSPKVSDTVVEPYNTVLAIHYLLEHADACVCIDNEALYDRCNRQNTNVSYGDLNQVISSVMSGTTCSFRFPGTLNNTLRGLALNLVPFPRLHFLIVSIAECPYLLQRRTTPTVNSFFKLSYQLFNGLNVTCATDPRHGRYLTAALTARGCVPNNEIESLTQRNSSGFVDWIPDSAKVSVCKIAPKDSQMSATLVSNSTVIQEVFKRVGVQYDFMFRRRAFLHWYTAEGVSPFDFSPDASDAVCAYTAEFCVRRRRNG